MQLLHFEMCTDYCKAINSWTTTVAPAPAIVVRMDRDGAIDLSAHAVDVVGAEGECLACLDDALDRFTGHPRVRLGDSTVGDHHGPG